MANVSDSTWAIVKETVPGTTPATPAFKPLEVVSMDFNVDHTMLTSETIRANRTGLPARKLGYNSKGSGTVEFRRDTTLDLILESAVAGTFSGNTLAAGNTDTSFTVEKKMLHNGAALYKRYTGCQVSSFGLSIDATGAVQASFEVQGMGSSNATAIITGATYPAATVGPILVGSDVASITIGALTLDVLDLELSINNTKTAQFKVGSKQARSVNTEGNREVTLSVTVYREDLSVETAFADNDTPATVSFNVGTGVNGYGVSLAQCVASYPQDADNAGSEMVNIEFTATSVTFSKLT